MHPALIDLLLQATTSVHGKADVLQERDTFPSRRFLEYPLSPDADRYFEYGSPFLQRYLPFWIATLIDRLKVMRIPIIVLLLPLSKMVPPMLRWRTRKRIYRWYRDLQEIYMALLQDDPTGGFSQYRQTLTQIEEEVAQLHVPLSYADQLYNLRLHIALIHDKINRTD